MFSVDEDDAVRPLVTNIRKLEKQFVPASFFHKYHQTTYIWVDHVRRWHTSHFRPLIFSDSLFYLQVQSTMQMVEEAKNLILWHPQ